MSAVRQAGRANPGTILPTFGPPPPPPPSPQEVPGAPIDNRVAVAVEKHGPDMPMTAEGLSVPLRVAGFLKVRDEILREGNLYRVLDTLSRTCDGGVLFDDQSNDGTWEALRLFALLEGAKGRYWHLMRSNDDERSFAREMVAKERMLRTLHAFKQKPEWILWLDGDETIQDPEDFRAWLLEQKTAGAFRLHYTQLWQNDAWARTDDGFDDGAYIKAWRYQPHLSFEVSDGTHHAQFPAQIVISSAEVAPFECYHWGNYGKNMQLKAHAYAGGLGGVDRHIFWGHEEPSLAPCIGYDIPYPAPHPTFRPSLLIGAESRPQPQPIPYAEILRIRALGNLQGLKGYFTVVIPSYNRAKTLPAALASLLAQTHTNWLAVVLDDGSTDDTETVMKEWQAKDPRIFYARYKMNRGGVAMNEIGMALACEWTEWWSRLGSDDWWGPGKLAADALALQSGARAVWGAFRVSRSGEACEACGETPTDVNPLLLAGGFAAGWACVAAQTSVLREVRTRFGNFVDPSLRNMEDFLFNARVAYLGIPWRWRPGKADEAFWNCCIGQAPETSASANEQVTSDDERKTRELIRAMVQS